MSSHTKKTPELWNEILRLFARGKSCVEIAKIINTTRVQIEHVHASTIGRWLRCEGIDPERKGRSFEYDGRLVSAHVDAPADDENRVDGADGERAARLQRARAFVVKLGKDDSWALRAASVVGADPFDLVDDLLQKMTAAEAVHLLGAVLDVVGEGRERLIAMQVAA